MQTTNNKMSVPPEILDLITTTYPDLECKYDYETVALHKPERKGCCKESTVAIIMLLIGFATIMLLIIIGFRN